MTVQELNSYTVLELRKIARSSGIVLGAGLSKAEIIQKIAEADPVDAQDVAEKEPARQNQSARFDSKPAYQATPSWQSGNNSGIGNAVNNTQHPVASRPVGYTPRFGPAVTGTPARAEKTNVPPRPVTPAPERRFGPAAPRAAAPSFGPGSAPRSDLAPADPRPVPPVPHARSAEQNGPYVPPVPVDLGIVPPTLEELLSTEEFEDGEGTLELHPDGYGFLRTSSLLPSQQDIYVSSAQIRRFALRTGDVVCGKLRPRREGDRYGALLYITAVNGLAANTGDNRQNFEELPTVPVSRKIDLQPCAKGREHIRLLDLIAPLGFGQRALLLAPPATGKKELLRDLMLTVSENHPETEILFLLLDAPAEEIEAMKAALPCPVIASSSDQPPETHLRLTELGLERAMRLVERGKDVLIVADSLTRLAKVYSSAAASQGRSLPGMVNPTSLFRAKKLFGTSRCIKDGGSLTILAAMDVATGSKVDDSVVEEFKGTAQVLLTLDHDLAQAGICPPLDVSKSVSREADLLLDPARLEGLRCIQSLLSGVRADQAIPQLAFLLDKAETNADLLAKVKDWFAMLSGK